MSKKKKASNLPRRIVSKAKRSTAPDIHSKVQATHSTRQVASHTFSLSDCYCSINSILVLRLIDLVARQAWQMYRRLPLWGTLPRVVCSCCCQLIKHFILIAIPRPKGSRQGIGLPHVIHPLQNRPLPHWPAETMEGSLFLYANATPILQPTIPYLSICIVFD